MAKYLSFIVSLLILMSCSSNDVLAPEPNQTDAEFSKYKEIIEKANWYYSQLPGKTRSVTPAVCSVKKIERPATRSNSEERPVYYIVNYENEQGFVVVGGNEIAEPMVAVSDECNLSIADTLNNPALASFMSAIIAPNPPVTPNPSDTVVKGGPVFKSVPPLLDKNVRKWGKGAPFNQGLPTVNNDGTRAKINDTQLALLMVMSYHEWPNASVNRNFDWAGIKQNPSHPHIGIILQMLGMEFGLNVQYGKEESFADPKNISQAAALMVYQCESFGRNFRNFPVDYPDSVRALLPRIMWGEITLNGTSHIATWVIDGLKVINEVDKSTGEITPRDYYYHCVWGDYGRGNGFFKVKYVDNISGEVADRIGGKRYSTDPTDGTYEGYQDSSNLPEYVCKDYMYSLSPMPLP